jgi:chloramphenicol-sensitive protein RarD
MNSELRRGVGFGFLAYLVWGIFPLYFHALDASGAVEILVHRIVWSLLALALVVAATRGLGDLRQLLRTPALVGQLAIAAVAIAVNWGIYIYAVNSGQVVEAALGYFINPLVTVALGVLVLKERLRPAQWTAVGIGVTAVVVLAVGYGRLPWIALTLACSFGLYGLTKKRVGGRVGALSGLTTETLVLAPLALGVLVWYEATGQGSFSHDAPWQALLLIAAGPVTVVPLLFFAAASRRVPLTTMGLLQYLTPVLQLLCGVLLLGETVPASRWIGFALVWTALGVLSIDSLRQGRSDRRARRRTAAERELLPTSA